MEAELRPDRQTIGWKFYLDGHPYGNYVILEQGFTPEDVGATCQLLEENAFSTLRDLLEKSGQLTGYKLIHTSDTEDPLKQKADGRTAANPG